ncbi:MAG: sugar phosphate isomerase/epimerase, partial [Alicyclobacillus sp.]|nr:sugar phosphate isomerase/epimerase [Alicyclobacillus sp.]
MFTLTGFADEISNDLSAQVEELKKLGIRHLELRGIWGKNVLELTEDDVAKVNGLLSESGCAVSSIASPIGKYPIREPFAPQQQAMNRAIELAKRLGAAYIRVFSYYVPQCEDPAQYRDEVISRMEQLARQAEQGGVTMVLENDRGGLYGDNDDRVLDIVQTVD